MTILNPSRKIGWSSTNNIRTGFGGGISRFQSNQAIYLNRTTVNDSTAHRTIFATASGHIMDSKRLSWKSSSRSLNSLCLLCGAFTLSKLVLFVIGSPAQFRNRFRTLSNVNRSGSQNASKNAAAAAEKTEQSNGVLMPRPVTMPIANDKRRRPERTEAIRILKPAISNIPKSVSATVAAHANDTVDDLGKRDVTAPVYSTK